MTALFALFGVFMSFLPIIILGLIALRVIRSIIKQVQAPPEQRPRPRAPQASSSFNVEEERRQALSRIEDAKRQGLPLRDVIRSEMQQLQEGARTARSVDRSPVAEAVDVQREKASSIEREHRIGAQERQRQIEVRRARETTDALQRKRGRQRGLQSDDLVRGIILSEVLAPPKSKRH